MDFHQNVMFEIFEGMYENFRITDTVNYDKKIPTSGPFAEGNVI